MTSVAVEKTSQGDALLYVMQDEPPKAEAILLPRRVSRHSLIFFTEGQPQRLLHGDIT